jgi:hypothetical protein
MTPNKYADVNSGWAYHYGISVNKRESNVLEQGTWLRKKCQIEVIA